MGNRRFIPLAIKEKMVSLISKGYTNREIAKLLDVNARTVRRVQRLAFLTGSVVRKPLHSGGPRSLNGLHVAVITVSLCSVIYIFNPAKSQFLEGCVERSPDVELMQLKQALEEQWDITVSTDTIARTLRRRGLTRKKVMQHVFEHGCNRVHSHCMWLVNPRGRRAQ